MLSKFSGSRRDLQFVLLLGILLATLGISLFLAVSMGSVAIALGDTYRIILSRLGFPLEIGEVSKSTLAIVWNMRFPPSITRSDSRGWSFHVWQCDAVHSEQSHC